MFTRAGMLTVVKALSGLATLALSTLFLYWAWRHVFSTTVSAWLALVMGLVAAVAVVLSFDRFAAGPALSDPRPAASVQRPGKYTPHQRGSRRGRP